jgi:inosine-uridine nucleoside N-ribohydrolase
VKILVDTDIGSDIDDALCLSYLLAHPDADLLGVTTVSGAAETRAQLVSALTHLHQKDIPIVAGRSDPMSGKQYQPEVPQARVLEHWPHATVFQEIPVEDFLAGQIRRHPGEVTLLAIGPLTNIALLCQRHPDCPGKLGRFVSMSGRFSNYQGMQDVPEWNTLCDISAAGTVYQSESLNNPLFVGSDVTRRLVLTVDDARERLSAPSLALVRDMSEIWFAGRDKMTVHDGLAAALLFDSDLCTYKHGRIVLEPITGATRLELNHESPVTVTESVDRSRFFERFFSVLSAGSVSTAS